MRRNLIQIAPFEDDVTRVALLESSDDVEERCLPGSIAPDQRRDLPGLNIQVDAIEQVERLFAGVRETHFDILDLQEHATS